MDKEIDLPGQMHSVAWNGFGMDLPSIILRYHHCCPYKEMDEARTGMDIFWLLYL
jgi:hypothetical protein